MNILLLGKNGQVGWELQRSLGILGAVVACDFDSPDDLRADFSDPESLAPLVRRVRPDVIVNAAAHTAVDKAEAEPDLARRINAIAPGVVAREAAAIGAAHLHPGKALLVVDCGTATTVEVVTATGDYLGGAILPGVGMSAESLASNTAKLPRVEIARPETALGRTSAESIQSGLYHGHVGAIRNLIGAITAEAFAGQLPKVIGTGGFARMFETEDLFDEIVPELVLHGLRQADRLNREPAAS